MKHYVSQSKPKLIILDIYNRVFCQSPYESAADLIQNCNSNSAALKMALQLGDIRGINLLAVRFATAGRPPMIPFKDRVHNGFWPIKHTIENYKPDNYI